MSLWVRIEGSPVRQLVMDSDALPIVDPMAATHALLLAVSEMRSTGTGEENASASITLANAAGETSAVFALRPPIGRAATIMDADAELFVGVIRRINFGDGSATMSIEA